MFEMIAFDADDTLWHNEPHFNHTHEKFRDLLAHYHDAEWIEKRLVETEIRNLHLFGYGIKGFTLSMIETAIELTEGRIGGNEIEQILTFGKAMLAEPLQLLEDVANIIELLGQYCPLMIITKGDLFDQETKVARSGLADRFRHIEIVSEKNPQTYQRILERYQITPEKFLMIGNSLKSDVLPVLTIGGKAIHIPYQTTWEHERVSAEQLSQHRIHALSHIGNLPEFLMNVFNMPFEIA